LFHPEPSRVLLHEKAYGYNNKKDDRKDGKGLHAGGKEVVDMRE
jgi:hypothetical protein